jgi:hypothetical protein
MIYTLTDKPMERDLPSWPDIDSSLLEDARGSVPRFPLEVLPPRWAQWVHDSAEAAAAPLDYVAQGLLAAVAAVCGAGVLARVSPSWSEPLVLWQALVGAPSSGKSPALAVTRRLLSRIEQELRVPDVEWTEHRDTVMPPQIVVSDSTLEALADVVAANPRGVILWRDELAAWLASLGRYANGGGDRAHWLEAWAAAGITINRRTRLVPLQLPRFPVSLIGTIQPDRLAESLQGSDDGMAARFLFAWPDPSPYRPLGERSVARDEEALARLQAIAHLAGTPDHPLALPFDPPALELLDGFLADLHRRTQAAEGLEAGWLGKGRGTVARLAALLTLLAWSEGPLQGAPDSIRADAVAGAIGLWSGYFVSHASSVLNRAGRSDSDRHARRAVRWLRQARLGEVGREDIRHDALRQTLDAHGTDRVLSRLVDANVLRILPPRTGTRGRPARRWQVHPVLVGQP